MYPAWVPLVCLAVALPVLLACLIPRSLIRAFVNGLTAFRSAWFVVAFSVATLYGGSKGQLWRFNFSNYVTDNGSYCTNDTIHAAWTFNEAYGAYTFRWCYRDLTMTNEVGVCYDEYHYLPDCLVSASNATATVQNATNMEVTCYAQYVAPVRVVTNGTYHVSGVMRTMATTNSANPSFATPAFQVRMTDDAGNVSTITPTNEPPPVAATVNVIYNEEE